LTSTDLQTRRARCQHQLSLLLPRCVVCMSIYKEDGSLFVHVSSQSYTPCTQLNSTVSF